MKNKMELLIAAQKHAAENIAVTDTLALTKATVAAFEKLGIADSNFADFDNMVNQARTQYLGQASVPVKAE